MYSFRALPVRASTCHARRVSSTSYELKQVGLDCTDSNFDVETLTCAALCNRCLSLAMATESRCSCCADPLEHTHQVRPVEKRSVGAGCAREQARSRYA